MAHLLNKATRVLLRSTNNRHSFALGRYRSRYQSTESAVPESMDHKDDGKVAEEEVVLSKFSQTQLMEEVPIKSLDILKKVERVEKKGSFTVDLFAGNFDDDFLIYPDVLDNRQENIKLKEQAAMVRQIFPKMWSDLHQLQKYNFFNLFQMSVSEMMTIFESVGEAARNCSFSAQPAIESEIGSQVQVTQSIISLITRNCLTYWPIHNSENVALKRYIPEQHILFGGLSNSDRLIKPIGFAWTEQAPNLGSVPPQEWLTLGQSGGSNTSHHSIVGKKSKILYDESVENYMIFFRDKILSDSFISDTPEDEPNPASDAFVGCLLVNKSLVEQSPVYTDSAGCKYVDIEFDTVLPDEQLVFPAERRNPIALNVKALGQLATCSVVMGILKDSLRMTYKHLIDNKTSLLDCDIIQRKLTLVTSRIFAIESMVYYIAGMFDGLKGQFDAHLETTILKVVTNEFAYESLKDLQHVCGSDMFITSKLQDQINIFDAFLDGNIHNKLYLATMGVLWYARNKNAHLNQLRLAPWYPGYFLKNLLKTRSERGDFLTIDADVYGNLHPSLKDAAVELEYIAKRIKHATEVLCMRHGKDITAAQSALYHLADLSIDTFLLTSMCARASKSYCNGSRNAEMDVSLTTSFALEISRKVRLQMENIQILPIRAFECRAEVLNELNIKHGGYYAESPLDPNI